MEKERAHVALDRCVAVLREIRAVDVHGTFSEPIPRDFPPVDAFGLPVVPPATFFCFFLAISVLLLNLNLYWKYEYDYYNVYECT